MPTAGYANNRFIITIMVFAAIVSAIFPFRQCAVHAVDYLRTMLRYPVVAARTVCLVAQPNFCF
ncbi:MAG: hypothetical protein ACSLEN_03380 [Candidatus Malihini olakiniferum]